MAVLNRVFVCLHFLLCIYYFCAAAENQYKAAVVEFHPPENVGDSFEILQHTVDEIVELLEQPQFENVDIIVLPEGAFNRLDTAVLLSKSENYCDDDSVHFLLRKISCVARKSSSYIVMNGYFKIKCNEDDQNFCVDKQENTNTYSTTIIFDRNGKHIAKYRKFNLFHEPVQVTEKPELITFQTDFNVTFGTSICLDLLSYWPQDAIRKRGVENFVYPTMWYSQLPHLSALQNQYGWASSTNVNLLAANINWPSLYCSGSGIYSGSQIVKTIYTSDEKTQVLIANVPKSPSLLEYEKSIQLYQYVDHKLIETNQLNDNLINNLLMKHEKLKHYKKTILKLQKNSHYKDQICKHNTCCSYEIETGDDNFVGFYMVGLFKGIKHYGTLDDLRTKQYVCTIVYCNEENNFKSCGTKPTSDLTKLNKLKLKLNLPNHEDVQIQSSVLTFSGHLLNTNEFEINTSVQNNSKLAQLNLLKPKNDLMTFAIFARDYSSHKIY